MAYIPFGTGPRNCIGLRFAQLETKVAIIKMMRNFHLLKGKDTPLKVTLDPKSSTVRCKDTLWVKLEPIARQ